MSLGGGSYVFSPEEKRLRVKIQSARSRFRRRDKINADQRAIYHRDPKAWMERNKKSVKKHAIKIAARKQKWVNENRERVRANHLAWRRERRSHVRSKSREWKRRNRDQVAASAARYYSKNRGAILARGQAYSQSHPEVGRQRTAKRRALQNSVLLGDIKIIRNWETKWRSAKSVSCFWCQGTFHPSRCESDHIVAIANHGAHSIENLCISCQRCNRRKNAKSLEQWNAKLVEPVLAFY